MLLESFPSDPSQGGGDCATDAAAQRRRALRKSVLLSATIYPIDVFLDARIRDLSRTGVRGEADIELAIGQILHLSVDNQTYHPGKVKWTLGRQFGLDLPAAIDIFLAGSIEVDHGQREGHHPRSVRVEIDVNTRLVAGRPPRPATVRNVSACGMLIDSGPGLMPGQHLIVRIGNASPIYGRTQWSLDGRIGFKAHNPMHDIAITRLAD